MRYQLLFVVSLLFGGVLTVCADDSLPEPQVLIDEMSTASRSLNYDGVFVYTLGKQIDTMRIIHKSGDGHSYERLISLTGHAREVIRDKDQVRCYFPENKAVVVEKSRLGKLISTYLPNPIQSISDFYIFEIAGEDRIAGLDAWIINIRPIDKYRYGYQLWIDKDSRLLLKSELKNQLGVTLEQIMFAQLNVLDDIDDALLEPSTAAEGFTWYKNSASESLSTKESEKQWKVTWMPAGFSMSEQSKEPMLTSHMPVEHLIYSDGLAMVSIYVEKLNQRPEMIVGASNFGGVNTYAVFAGGYQITAVGEVPKSTVKLMADSVKSYH
ncbi:MAG: sigma factor AlgU regulatory protein MucB [marine bacterium B5-7]|nr:MAG: sigma factor AlgU regulatory protein MucB [marine bacterium B5-7]